MLKHRGLWVTLLVLTLAGCSHRDPYGPAKLAPFRPSATNPHERVAGTNNRFAFALFEQLRQEQPGKNLVLSPLSLGLALAMVYNGAGTTTQTAIGKTLQIDGMTVPQANQQYRALWRAVLHADRQVEVDLANSLWITKGWEFTPAFLDVTRRFYDAQVQSLQFRAPGAADTINAWVREKTHGKINDIVSQQSLGKGANVAVLLDAAYFKGHWTNPFMPGMTEPGKFTTLDGSERDVMMMKQHGEYQWLEVKDFQAISLPYASGRLSCYVFLPKQKQGLAAFCRGLSQGAWEGWMRQFAPQKGILHLPRFKVETDLQLDRPLKHLGMTDAFAEGRADFGPMCQPAGIWLSDTRQRVYLQVHEKGTEAAAVTRTIMAAAGGPGSEFEMTVDHPFFCAIRDNGSGAIVFMGTVVDPGNGRYAPWLGRSARVE